MVFSYRMLGVAVLAALQFFTLSLATTAPPMPSLKLRNGVEMPIMSAGTWLYSMEEAQKSVVAALDAGFTHIDTAYDYQNQEGVAKGIQHAIANGKTRKSIFLTTKVPGCGIQNVSASSIDQCKSDTAARIADDLRLLDVEYIDLLLLHFPPCPGDDGSAQSPMKSSCYAGRTGCSNPKSCDMIKAQWSAVSDAYHKKQLRSVGVSNYCSACLACLDNMGTGDVAPMVNQVHYQVGMGPDPQHFKTAADKRGIVLQAWSPLGMGGNGSKPIIQGNLTTNLGKKYNKSPVQIALKWIVSNNVSVSTKSSNPAILRRTSTSLISSWILQTKKLWTKQILRLRMSHHSCAGNRLVEKSG
jgi:diketogulonate reductase-like aldo/keto reductase